MTSFLLSGDHNVLNGLEFIDTGILVSGNNNRLENMCASKSDRFIEIRGSNNSLHRVHLIPLRI